MYSIPHLFTRTYWFDNVPFLGVGALWAQIMLYAVFVAGGIAIEYWIAYKKPDKMLTRLLRKKRILLITMGCIGFLFLFFRYEFVPVFSRRFMYAVWALGVLAWAGFLAPEYMKLPARRAAYAEEERRRKYMPHR